MSSFIVSDSLLRKIATLVTGFKSSDYRHCFYGTEFYDVASIDPQKMIDALFLMNCDAIDARYGEGSTASKTATKVGLVRFVRAEASQVALYKGIQCYLYQCSEGDVDESPLYKAVQAVKATLADRIIKTRFEAQYDAAPWGE